MKRINMLYRIVTVAALLGLIMLLSCRTPYAKIAKLDYKHPIVFTEYVMKRFEPVTQIKDSFIYLKGKDSVRVDTVSVDIDSLLATLKPKTKTFRMPCPPCVIPQDTLLHFRSVEKENKVKTENFQLREKLHERRIAELEKDITFFIKRNHNLIFCLSVSVVLNLLLLIWFFKRLF